MQIGNYKSDYFSDQSLFDTRLQWVTLTAFLLALAAIPFVASPYWTFMACLIAINVASATGLNILTGFTGLVSLGQAAFMSVGAYTTAVLEIHTSLPLIINLLVAGGLTALVGALVGLPSLRVKGLYLAIATIAASIIIHFIVAHWPLTGETRGLSMPPATIFGLVLDQPHEVFWIIMPVTVLMVFGAANLFRTRIGRAFIAIRDRDISAEVLGIPLLRYKLMSFAVSSFYAGVAGGLWAYFFRVITPESFPLLQSIFFLAAIIVGGLGSIRGAIFGAIFMTLVPELLKLIMNLVTPIYPEALATLAPVRTMVFGFLILAFLIYEPRGLNAIWVRARRFFHNWPFKT